MYLLQFLDALFGRYVEVYFLLFLELLFGGGCGNMYSSVKGTELLPLGRVSTEDKYNNNYLVGGTHYANYESQS